MKVTATDPIGGNEYLAGPILKLSHYLKYGTALPRPALLGKNEPIPRNDWIALLGGIEDWCDVGRVRMAENIEIDAVWRIKPIASMVRLITSCFEASV